MSTPFLLMLLGMFGGCGAYYYNYYVFAMQWPPSLCSNKTATGSVKGIQEPKCLLAKNITSWTIHGLWPSVNESYPEYCNKSWPLNETVIYPLEDEMRARWPSFAGGDLSFWDHEWSKHGTCATLDQRLYGPYNFFKFVLQLAQSLKVLEKMSSRLIIPSDSHCYNYTTFTTATKHLFNESLTLGCVWDPVAKKQHIAQIEFCFDKQFQLNCKPDQLRANKPRNYDGPRSWTMPEVTPCWSSQDICYSILDSNI